MRFLASWAGGPALLLALASASALTLEEAVEGALARHERIGIVERRVEAAEARVDAARSRLRPDLTFQSEYLHRGLEQVRTIGGIPQVTQGRDAVSGSASLEVPLVDRASSQLVRGARLESERAALDRDDERRLLVRDVTDTFLLALSSEQVLEAAQTRLEFADRSLDEARARAEAGIASSNDVTKVEIERASAQREVTRARAAVENARLGLGLLTGSEVEGALVPPEGLLRAAQAAPTDEAAVIERAHAQRKDLAARRKAAEAARAFADEPMRRGIPSLDLESRYDASDETGRRDDWSVALGLTWEAWDGGLRAADRRERRAVAGEADLVASRLERETTLQVRRALVDLRGAQAAIGEAEAAVAASRRNAEETSELYREGLRTGLEVADAGARLFDASVSLTRERLSLALAWTGLVVAAGGDPLTTRELP